MSSIIFATAPADIGNSTSSTAVIPAQGTGDVVNNTGSAGIPGTVQVTAVMDTPAPKNKYKTLLTILGAIAIVAAVWFILKKVKW